MAAGLAQHLLCCTPLRSGSCRGSAAVTTYVSTQQCVTETSECRRRPWRTQRMSALSPAEVTGLDPATFEQLGSSEVGTPADSMTWHQVLQRISLRVDRAAASWEHF